MHPYPHSYRANANGTGVGPVVLSATGLPDLDTAPPVEFGGPGGAWSPETLLVAAVADCFILTFREVARAGNLSWGSLQCTVEGTLDRVAGVTRFSRYLTTVALTLAPGADAALARSLLEKSEKICLVSNSLTGERDLKIHITEPTA